MDVRLIAASSLLLAAAAFAQEPQQKGAEPPRATPAPAPGAAPAAKPQDPATKPQNPAAKPQDPATKPQDPDRPAPTPAQVLEELQKERDRLAREIAYAKARAQTAKADLATRLKPPTSGYRAIDAGVLAVPTAAPAAPQQPRNARIGTAEEFANQDADTMLLVNGRPIRGALYEQLMTFRKTAVASAEDVNSSSAVLFELIQIEGVASALDDNEARERMGEIDMQLDAGKPMADLAKEVGVVPGTGPDGAFETTRNSMFGTVFASHAFATEAGKRARAFRNAHGIVMLKVEKVTKGATPELDSVSGNALQVPYTTEPGALQRAQLAVNTGQVDIVVKDKAVLELLPPMFRRDTAPTALPVRGVDATKLRNELDAVSKEMQELQGKDDEESKRKRADLETRYATLKRQLRAAESGAATAPDAAGGQRQPQLVPMTEKPKEQGTQPPPKQN